MQAFQNDIKGFEKHNAQVLGVSSDSLETHREFTQQHNISFPLISDDGSLKKLYSKKRTTFIIDQSGIIRFIHQGVPVNLELLLELETFATEGAAR